MDRPDRELVRTRSALQKSVANRFSNATPICNAKTLKKINNRGFIANRSFAQRIQWRTVGV
jgi:hypothetical protein